MRSRALVPMTLTLLVTLAACQVLVKLDGTPSSTDGDASDGATVPTACSPFSEFRPPSGARGGQTTLDFVFGFLATEATDAGSAQELCPDFGFDLDQRTECSCENDRNKRICDPEQSPVDNEFADLFGPKSLATFRAVDVTALDPATLIRGGSANVVMQITGYNEQPDDPDVLVAMFGSTGLADRSANIDASRGEQKTWDGRSLREWAISPKSYLADGHTPAVRPYPAFVERGVLVVESPRAALLGFFPFDLREFRMTGELRKRGDSWEIVRGRIGGRAAAAEAARYVLSLPLKTGDLTQTLCQGDSIDFVREFICAGADLSTGGPQCDEISIGFGFVAVPARIGPIAEAQVAPIPCDADASCR